MRDALFFLSLSLLLSFTSIFRIPFGVLIAITLFVITLRVIFTKRAVGLFDLLTVVLIGIVLSRSVMGLPFTKAIFHTAVALTILLVLIFAGQSSENDIAPTFAMFAVFMLLLRVFSGIQIPEKLSWGVLLFLTTASKIDDWNMKRHLFVEEEPPIEECVE